MRSRSALLGLTVLLSASALERVAAQQPTEAASGTLQEVVVTASKRTQNSQDVPASLTALSSAELATQGVTGFNDYMTLVPSLADFSGGSEGHGAIILRGLNTGYYQTSNTVGYYIDDIPFSATSPLSVGALLTLDPDLSDIDHLEVLKGPQATLYGASTLGGLIKVVTNRPDPNAYSGDVQLGGSTVDGGGSGYDMVGVANIPLIDGSLALRMSGFDRDIPGYMTDVALGTHDRAMSRRQGGRIALRWVVAPNLDIQINTFLQSLYEGGWNYEFINLQTQQPLTGPYTYSSDIDARFHTTYELYNVSINYTAGSLGTLTSSTSYARYHDLEIEDYDQWYGELNAFAPVPVPANADQPLFFGPTMSKFTEETRFASNRMGPFEWLAGVFYTRELINYPVELYNVIPPSLTPIPGPDAVSLGVNSPAYYKEYAAFADLTYYISQSLDLTVGGRFSHNEQGVTDYTFGFANTTPVTTGTTSDHDWSYLAALTWHLTQSVNTYARVASSYRPGGPELTPEPPFTAFKPDSLVNYEIGLKADWLDNRLRTNLAVYYMDWKNVQMSFVYNDFDVIANGGKATSKGVEFESQYAPIKNLTLSLNSAYTEAVLNSVSSGVSEATGAVAGNQLPFTPRWAASALADYVMPLNGAMKALFGATYRYQGAKWSDYPLDPNNTGVIIPAYRTLELRTGLTWDRYKLMFRINNVTDSQGFDTIVQQRIFGGNPPAWAAIIPPRTYSLMFEAVF